ncbi:MAG: peptide chain release factor N(5)-glutamine methyltransferase [Bacteroidaceae bacterium]|nr:peptide chain release factor N(5)-glutamine methyltransferase [Bacteroidaceae bacterium]
MNYRTLVDALTPMKGRGEARAIARMVMEEAFGLSQTDILMGRDEELSIIKREELQKIASRLLEGEPVQHIIGHTYFCGHKLRVTRDVLIPRPETEELAEWAITTAAQRGDEPTVIDLCTGSGAIAIALSKALPHANVHAVDISSAALDIAAQNISSNEAQVTLHNLDVLYADVTATALPQADVIVSNPPYVRSSEAADMDATVLDHEPHLALFVPDADPLLFYRAIAETAVRLLKPGGSVLAELNANLATATCELFDGFGFTNIELRKDIFGRDRMLRCNALQNLGRKETKPQQK